MPSTLGPDRYIQVWFGINLFIAIYSLGLLSIIILSKEEGVFLKMAQSQYLTYCLVTCFFWWLQTVMGIFHIGNQYKDEENGLLMAGLKNSDWHLRIELVAALAFLIMAIYEWFDWQLSDNNDFDMFIVVFGCLLAYIWLCWFFGSVMWERRKERLAAEAGAGEVPTENTPLVDEAPKEEEAPVAEGEAA